MKTIIIMALMMSGLTQADVLRPPRPNYDEQHVNGIAAKGLYNLMDVAAKPGEVLRHITSEYKVLRADNDLSELLCYKTVSRVFSTGLPRRPSRSETTYSCRIKTSTDGQAVPAHRHVPRLG